jgi:hypothetical protein
VTLNVTTRVSLVGLNPPTVDDTSMNVTPSAVAVVNAEPTAPDSASSTMGSFSARAADVNVTTGTVSKTMVASFTVGPSPLKNQAMRAGSSRGARACTTASASRYAEPAMMNTGT